MKSDNRNLEAVAAPPATENVDVIPAGDGNDFGPNFFRNPATGAYEPTPEFLEKGRDALAAAAYEIKIDLKKRHLLLKLQLVTLKLRLSLVKLRIHAHRVLLKLGFD